MSFSHHRPGLTRFPVLFHSFIILREDIVLVLEAAERSGQEYQERH